MAGPGGFEPPHAGIKTPCLTAWLHPNRFPPTPSSLLKDGSSPFPSPRALPLIKEEGETPTPSLPKGEGEGGGILPEVKK